MTALLISKLVISKLAQTTAQKAYKGLL